MTSGTLRTTIDFAKQQQTKHFNINYWQVTMAGIIALILAGYILEMLTGSASIILCSVILLSLAMKPVYDILKADFEINLDNLELKNIHEELWD